VIGLCAVLGLVAWSLRFVQDDADIVFRYAEHLSRGEGLVWNVGERVEGYSSFLYTVLLGGTQRLGLDPVTTSHALGLAAFVGSLLTTFQAARLTFGSATHGLLTMALLGANYTFYWLIPVAVLTVVLLPRLLREGRDALVASVLLAALWIPYVARVGGDFMEFRFMVSLLPALMLLIVATLRAVSTPRWFAHIVAIVLAGSASHAVGYGLEPSGLRPESRDDLLAHLTSPDQNWVGIGPALREAAGDDRTLTIAVAPAGAIPDHSKLPSIDMLGLSDRWVARNGDILGSWPGHQRVAPYSYLERRGVHLVIGTRCCAR